MKRQTKKKIKYSIGFLIFILTIYLSGLYLIQDYFIFYPDRDYQSPSDIGWTQYREHPLVMKDGTRIMTWYAKGDPQKPAVLYFHGNASQNAVFAPYLKAYLDKGYTVLIPEYRGFGNTPGKTTEENMFSDAIEAYDFLKSEGYPAIIVHGFSFGCAVALGLTQNRMPDGVVLEAPFASLKQMVAETKLPLATFVLKAPFESDAYIQHVTSPLLILHGTQDKTIPLHHAQKLFSLAQSPDKTFLMIADGTHFLYKKGSPDLIADWIARRFN